MTFKDLKKRVTIEVTQHTNLFERLQNKPTKSLNVQKTELERFKGAKAEGFREVK